VHTINPRITFDPAKERANLAKHNLSLTRAVYFDWDTAVTVEDVRHPYGEARLMSVGYIDARLHCVVYVVRDNHYRIISLRKANTREVKRYANT